jgi:membrane-associated protease RseP (regulator of RpoE activity)
MLFLIGVVLFAVGLLVSIALHEVGHLVPAKRSGVKVTQYMVGFGPTLWSTRRGETEYGLKWIPLGGYIRMIGMFPPRRGDAPGRLRSSSTGPFQAMIEDARNVSLDEVAPGDEDRVFYRQPVRRKVLIMMSGPLMNLLIAFVLLAISFSFIGTPTYAATTQIAVVPQCVAPAGADRSGGCQPGDPASPAAAAGIREGDRIVSFSGRPISEWAQLQKLIRSQPAGPVQIGVERDGAKEVLTADLVRTERPRSATDATPVDVGFLGVSPKQVVAGRDTLALTALPGQLWNGLWQTGKAVAGVPQRMVGVWNAAFSGQTREADGPVGIVGVGRIGGEVAALADVPLYAKLSQLIAILGSVNLALFVFNLIPLLPLDGGHVAGALWEGLRRQFAKLRSRPDPGPVDVARMLPVAYSVALVLIGMSALLLYADIVNPVRLGNM